MPRSKHEYQPAWANGKKCAGCEWLMSKLEWESHLYTPDCPRCADEGRSFPGWIRLGRDGFPAAEKEA